MPHRARRSIGGQRACGEQRRRRERTTGIGLRDDNASRGRRHKGQRRHPRSSPGITARQPTARLDPCTPRRTHADHAGMNADRFRRGSVSAHHGRRSTPRARARSGEARRLEPAPANFARASVVDLDVSDAKLRRIHRSRMRTKRRAFVGVQPRNTRTRTAIACFQVQRLTRTTSRSRAATRERPTRERRGDRATALRRGR